MGEHPLHGPVLRWYDEHARDLPWRAPDRTPWGVLVSEVMLQQTPVARVLPVWLEWLRRWPEPSDLAREAPGEAVRAWGRLGYPRRALRLHQGATQIGERHGGRVPTSYDDLLTLAGVGTYTAAAVATFAFGARHAVVDTNVRRVLARAVTGTALPAPVLTRAEVTLAEQLVPDDAPTAARWAVAVMELGALVCTARSPRCSQCPVRAVCAWQLAGSPEYDGPARRVRGRLMAVVRAAHSPVPEPDLVAATVDVDPAQRRRALASLIQDGLLEPAPGATFALPRE